MAGLRKSLGESTGHWTKEEILYKEEQEKAAIAPRKTFKKAPEGLIDKLAMKEWRRITGILDEMELIGDLDMAALVGYCNAFSFYRRATDQLAKEDLTIVNEKGVFKNPLVDIQDKYANQMRMFATKAGLSIDTRLKFATLKTKNDDNEVFDEFGI